MGSIAFTQRPGDAPLAQTTRIASLDQFRGYTVVGMLFVNFLNGFEAWPSILKHHNTYCSYSDTIMPQFFFAVGFAFRLTYLRRMAVVGQASAVASALRRSLGLILVGFVVYHLDGGVKSWGELQGLGFQGFFATAFKRELFQTLVHIAITSVWVLPVISARPTVRIFYLVGSAALHFCLSKWFYFDFAWNTPVIDGGQLGFLTWTVPLLVGTLAYDVVNEQGTGLRTLAIFAGFSGVLMAAGVAMAWIGGAPVLVESNAPVTIWTMSQRTGSVSYLTFASGVSLAVYAVFVIVTDRAGLNIGLFRTFGTNALLAYLLHDMVASAVKPWMPKDAPGWYVAVGFGVYFGLNTLFIRNLEKNGLFLKL